MYKITITKIEQKTVTKPGPHTVIDERPWKNDELDNECRYRSGVVEFLESTPLKKVFGYAPPQEVVEEREIQILQQVVDDDLDLIAVIKAINGIKPQR